MGLGSCSANSEQTRRERFIDADHSSAQEGRAGDTVRPRRSKVVGWGDPKELGCWLRLTDGLGPYVRPAFAAKCAVAKCRMVTCWDRWSEANKKLPIQWVWQNR